MFIFIVGFGFLLLFLLTLDLSYINSKIVNTPLGFPFQPDDCHKALKASVKIKA